MINPSQVESAVSNYRRLVIAQAAAPGTKRRHDAPYLARTLEQRLANLLPEDLTAYHETIQEESR